MKTSKNFQYIGKDADNKEIYYEEATNRLYKQVSAEVVVHMADNGIEARAENLKYFQ